MKDNNHSETQVYRESSFESLAPELNFLTSLEHPCSMRENRGREKGERKRERVRVKERDHFFIAAAGGGEI